MSLNSNKSRVWLNTYIQIQSVKQSATISSIIQPESKKDKRLSQSGGWLYTKMVCHIQILNRLAATKQRQIYLCWVAANTVWSHMAGDTLQLCDGFPIKSYTPPLPYFTAVYLLSQLLNAMLFVSNLMAQLSQLLLMLFTMLLHLLL